MRVLVMGGTGAMGKALVPLLVSQGSEVTVASRTGRRQSIFFEERFTSESAQINGENRTFL